MCDEQVIYISPLQDNRVCLGSGLWGMAMYYNEELYNLEGNRHWRSIYQGESLKDCFKRLKNQNKISKDEYLQCIKKYCR